MVQGFLCLSTHPRCSGWSLLLLLFSLLSGLISNLFPNFADVVVLSFCR